MVADGCWMNQNQSIGNSKEHHSLSVSLCLFVCRSLSGCLPVSLSLSSLSLSLFISLSIYICVFFYCVVKLWRQSAVLQIVWQTVFLFRAEFKIDDSWHNPHKRADCSGFVFMQSLSIAFHSTPSFTAMVTFEQCAISSRSYMRDIHVIRYSLLRTI